MEEYIQGGNIFFEVIPLNKCQKKIIIYLSKNNGKFEQECKCYASHYLEQICNLTISYFICLQTVKKIVIA